LGGGGGWVLSINGPLDIFHFAEGRVDDIMGIKGAHHPRASFSPHETAGPMKGQTDDSSCRQFLAGYIALRVVGPLDTYESMKIT